MKQFDLIVIGAGPGGYPAAIRGAQLNASVAMVEKEQFGGTCLNWGCIPSKALIAAAETYHNFNHVAPLGITTTGVALNYGTLIANKNQTIAMLRAGIRQLLSANGVQQFNGVAQFIDAHTLQVIGAGESQHIRGNKIIIATGSTSLEPGFLPQHERVVESRKFLDRVHLPKSLIILGGGFIGCEIACMAAKLGVVVTLVELLPDILANLDLDVRNEVRMGMEKNLKIRIMTGKAAHNCRADGEKVTVEVGGEELSSDLLLNATGRKPVTEGLELNRAGLSTNARGFIEADLNCRTRVPHIFAIGDVTGKLQLAHYATAQGIIAAENAVTGALRTHATLVPSVIFTSPEVGAVGLTEQEAKQKNRAVNIGKFRYAALGKSLAVAKTCGFAKLIADAETDQLLGAAVVGAHATELLAEATVAIRAELTSREVAGTIHAHPTFSEIWMESAHQVHGEAIHAAPTRRVVS